MKKVKNYTRNLNVKLTEEEFQILLTIRNKYKKTSSKLIRESLMFYHLYLTETNKAD